MAKLTKAQKAKQELVKQTMLTTLTAGTNVLQTQYHFSDKQSGMWILLTSRLLAEHIGTDEVKAELDEALKVLEDG